jgi:1,4-alpha-glucan branching enzyme
VDYLEFHIRGGPLKYNRITDRKGETHKQPYVPEWAESKVSTQAQHFMESRNFRFEHISHWYWKKPLVVATYDAELFGHHWYEGPKFLYYLFKKMYYDQNQTELTTPSIILQNISICRNFIQHRHHGVIREPLTSGCMVQLPGCIVI